MYSIRYIGLAMVVGVLGTAIWTPGGEPMIIPQPAVLEQGEGEFTLNEDTRIVVFPGDEAARGIADELAGQLRRVTGFPLPVTIQRTREMPRNVLMLSVRPGDDSGEGYELEANRAQVRLQGTGAPGLFYAVQSLYQLLPPDVYGSAVAGTVPWTIPAVKIKDAPRFEWRGLHLDVGRHYMPVDAIKRFLDGMALHKLNIFHWHLTEDQGWRLEIKQYPKLTSVGSIRSESPKPGNRNQGNGTPYGPLFYTQDEVREIVAYAAARYITVVPEIELPGHSLAALTAYPELGCTAGPYQVRTRWGVEPDIYCAGKEETFTFLENVLGEVLELFPSGIIHIGGDEAPKARWEKCPSCRARIEAEGLKDTHELQSWFITRMEKWLNQRDRRIIGWDEILEGGLAPNAAVMSWRGEKGGIAAARSGHDVVMSPTSHCYFDYYQAKGPDEPEAIGGFLPLRKVYSYDPVPGSLTPEQGKHILGAQGNLWTEYMRTPEHVEYMAYPRGSALAELAWTRPDRKDYTDFLRRLGGTHLARLDKLGINYRALSPEPLVVGHWKSGETTETWTPRTWDVTRHVTRSGPHRVTFMYTGGTHRLDIQKVEILSGEQVVASEEHWATAGGRHENNTYTLHFPDPASGPVRVRAEIRSDGGTDSNGDLFLLPGAP